MNHKPALFLILLLFALSIHAEETLRFSGFATLGASWLSTSDVDFAPNVQPKGPGRSQAIDFGLDSRVGGQIDLQLNDALQVTVQGVIQRQPERNYKPALSLAHLRWQALDSLTLRIGRMQDNSLLASEYRLANLPNPWIRPPPEVYGVIPLIHEDGLDANWQTPLAGGNLDFTISLSQGDYTAPRSNHAGVDSVEVRRTKRLVARWQSGNWLAKASWGERKISYDPVSLQSALQTITTLDKRAGDQLVMKDTPLQTWTAGISYDSDTWLFMSEWARSRSVSAYADAEGAYFTLGRRFGKTMPFFGMATRNTGSSRIHSNNAVAEAIICTVFEGQRRKNVSLTLGLNHALQPNLILRSQIDFICSANTSSGPPSYENHASQYNFRDPSREHLITVGMDFIF